MVVHLFICFRENGELIVSVEDTAASSTPRSSCSVTRKRKGMPEVVEVDSVLSSPGMNVLPLKRKTRVSGTCDMFLHHMCGQCTIRGGQIPCLHNRTEHGASAWF